MQEAQVRRILVVDDGRLVGIVSRPRISPGPAPATTGSWAKRSKSVIEKVSEDTGTARA